MERTLNLESHLKGSTHKWKYGIKILESLLKWGPYDPQLQSLPSKKISLKLLKKGIIVNTNRHLMHLSQLEEPMLTTPLINWMLDLQHRGKIRVHQCAVSIPRIRCIPPIIETEEQNYQRYKRRRLIQWIETQQRISKP